MESSQHLVAKAACSVAGEVPLPTLEMLCQWIAAATDLNAAKANVAQFAHSHYRGRVLDFLDACLRVVPSLSTSAASLALLSAGFSEQAHRHEHSMELVWTGPDADVVPFRRTEQAILQVLDSAQHRITLISYAVYQIPNVREALVRAARRGVQIKVVVETPDRLEGQNEYSTIKALGNDVAACAAVYFWPQENRRQNHAGKVGILHVKCAVADGRWLFLSSANLTEYAFDINMELGTLVTGGKMPPQVEANFDRLIATGVLERI